MKVYALYDKRHNNANVGVYDTLQEAIYASKVISSYLARRGIKHNLIIKIIEEDEYWKSKRKKPQ